jgi:hypothetical protein
MKTPLTILREAIELTPANSSDAMLYRRVVIEAIDDLIGYEKEQIKMAWEDGQGNIPHFASWSHDDYEDAEEYFKSNYEYVKSNKRRDISERDN